jgi:hypothetical protein
MMGTEVRKIASMSTVSQLLPFLFNNGSRIDNIGMNCGKCGKDIPSAKIKGTAHQINEHCTAFSGYGFCYECRTITPVECRFADDGSFLSRSGTGWRLGIIAMDNSGLLVNAWRRLRSIVSGKDKP